MGKRTMMTGADVRKQRRSEKIEKTTANPSLTLAIVQASLYLSVITVKSDH
jgi:hypothetical protein